MREIGEIASNTRFRFMTGVQEAVFDSERFAHMADSLRRVKDNFQQVLIDRQDISFVVAELLLRKDAEQSAFIRQHLERFAKFYENMTERMDLFVQLYPVHPDYLGVFENIAFAEKRSALTTLSTTIKALLPQDVPSDIPELIIYDSYWQEVRLDDGPDQATKIPNGLIVDRHAAIAPATTGVPKRRTWPSADGVQHSEVDAMHDLIESNVLRWLRWFARSWTWPVAIRPIDFSADVHPSVDVRFRMDKV